MIALKAGRTAAGSRAGTSHTAAAATPEVTVSALLRQAGVITCEAARLVAGAGIPLCPAVPTQSADEAVAAAQRLGYPVVLKTAAAVAHKTELGGVRLGLSNDDEVRAAYAGVALAGGEAAAGVVVQPVVRPGVELLVGINRAEPYPPVVLIGLGGTATELLDDKAVRLAPLTDLDAERRSGNCAPRPCYWATADVPRPTLRRSRTFCCGSARSQMRSPNLAELDLNPVIARPDGVLVVDVKARLAPVAPDEDLLRDPLLRRLR